MTRIRGIHARTHPFFVEGCLNCKLLSVSISPAATPTRADNRYRATDDLEKQWNRDLPAYKRMVDAGIQPDTVDGAYEMEKSVDAHDGAVAAWD